MPFEHKNRPLASIAVTAKSWQESHSVGQAGLEELKSLVGLMDQKSPKSLKIWMTTAKFTSKSCSQRQKVVVFTEVQMGTGGRRDTELKPRILSEEESCKV